MPTVAVVELGVQTVRAGLLGSYRCQVEKSLDQALWDDNCGFWDESKTNWHKSSLHFLWVDVLDQLLVTATKTQVLVVEPPLMPYTVKQWLAQVLLEDIRVLSLSFLPYSVCAAVGVGKKHGLVAMRQYGEVFLVPVYEYRELTPSISSARVSDLEVDDDEMPLATLVGRVRDRVGYDIRKSMVIINVDVDELGDRIRSDAAYIGAHIIAENSTVTHLVSRKKYLKHEQDVFDSLFSQVA